MRLLALSLVCFGSVLTCNAQLGVPRPTDWQNTRKAQPEGLTLKLTLPKDHYYQGEVINAALKFSNTPPQSPIISGSAPATGQIEFTDIALSLRKVPTKKPMPDPLA